MFFIYTSKNFSASVYGERMRGVVCDKCETTYYYALRRVATGRASAPYYVGQEGAQKRAHAIAEKLLATRLDEDVELVPCPKCNWVNEELIEQFRRRRHRMRWGSVVMWMLLVVILGFLSAVVVGESGRRDERTNERVGGTFVVFAVAALMLPGAIWWKKSRRRKRIDPNVTYPRAPELPVGTPPALVPGTDRQTKLPSLVPACGEEQRINGEGWLVLRPGEFKLAAPCCVCLGEATTTYRSSFYLNETSKGLAMPLCRRCSWALWRQWWMIALLTVIAAAGLVALVGLSWKGGDATGRWILAGIAGFFVALIGMATLPNKWSRPYWIKAVDAERGIVKFKARNGEYTKLMAGLVMAQQRSAA